MAPKTTLAAVRSRRFTVLQKLSFVVLASGALLAPHLVFAQSDAFDTNPTATGGVANFSGNFTLGTTTPAASGTGTPNSGDALYFGSSTTTTLNDDLAAGTVFAGLFFNAGASAFTIGGNAFTLSAGITNNSAASQTINNAITLNSSLSFSNTLNGGSLTFGGGVSGAGFTLTTNGGPNGAIAPLNTNFTAGTVTLGTLNAQGNGNAGPNYSNNQTTTFNGTSVLNAANVNVQRSNLVFGGNSVVTVTGNIGQNDSWGNLVITGSANVTAANVLMNSNGSDQTGQLLLNGGTVTTGSLGAYDRGNGSTPGAQSALVFNGTQVNASASSGNFVSISTSNGGVQEAFIGTGGLLLNTGAFNETIGAALVDLSTAVVSGNPGLTGLTAGAGFLTKSGTGTLTLSGVNTYSGGTNITGGTLQLGVSSVGVGNAVTSGAVGKGTVQLAGSVDLNGKTLGNNVTLTANSAILNSSGTPATAAGNVSGAYTLTTNGNASGYLVTNFTGTTSVGALQAQGSGNNGPDNNGTTNPTTIFNNASLTTTGNVSIGRSDLIFQGTTTANIGGTLGTAGATSSDWADTTIRDSANVTITGGVDLTANGSVTGQLTLLGGTLTTSGFMVNNRGGGGQTNVTTFNGTQVVATGANTNFINVVNQTNGGGNYVFAGTGGAIFNTNGFDLTIAAGIQDLTTSAVSNGVQQGNTTGVGAGTLTKLGLGTLTLSGASTYSGGTTISAGTIAAGSDTALGTGAVSLSGGALQNSGNRTLANNLFATAATTSTVADKGGGNFILNGSLTGSGTLNFGGPDAASVQVQGDLSGFTGTINYNVVTNGNNLFVGTGANGNVNLSGAKLVLSGATSGARRFGNQVAGTVQIGELSGTGGQITAGINGSTYQVGALNTSSSYAGTINNQGTDVASVTKVGTGTLTLTGTNGYTGATAINGGTLNAGGTGALGSTGGIVINTGGTLLLSGATTTGASPGGVADRVNNAAPITLGTTGGTGNGGTIAVLAASGTTVTEGTARSTTNGGTTTTASPYATGSATSVVGIGALTLASNSTLDFGTLGGKGTLVFSSFVPGGFTLNILNYVNTTTNGSTVSGVSGTDDRLTFNSDQSAYLANFSFNGAAGASEVALDSGFFEIVPMAAPVPEPATWLAGLLSLGVLGYRVRRRLSGMFESLRAAS